MKPQVTTYSTPVHSAAPQAIAIARGLGWLFGKAIRGDNGAVRYGYPQIGMRAKYQGYVFPPQIFTGYDASKVARGAVRVATPALSTNTLPQSETYSPLTQAMANVTGLNFSSGRGK
jgi:hypothetical protein